MSHIRIDKSKALKKWSPVLENMGVSTEERLDWMSEYAEYHSINENAYVNAGIAGMGAITAPQASTLAGITIGGDTYGAGGTRGSGDLGQNLLPVAMKIAAQTIGLDLVAVKPTPGPKIDLLYIDFQYDDVNLDEARPQVFKVYASNISAINSAFTSFLTANNITQTQGGLKGARVYTNIKNTGAVSDLSLTESDVVTTSNSKLDVVEFLGFSRIDGYPMLKAYRQYNATGFYGSGVPVAYNTFDQTKNTFNATATVNASITALAGASASSVSVELISALEDHIPGFVSNWTSASGQSGTYPMSRQDDDNTYAGVIGPKVSSKSVAVGTIEVSSALRRSEIEDIKANTGMDIVQKMESILVNELSQTISKQIISKVFEMGDLNRTSAPAFAGTVTITGQTIFDLDSNYATTGPGGETTHAVQRKLITKMVHASNYIATEGRVGPAQYLVTNGGLGAALMDVAGYTINPVKSKMNGAGQMYPVGQIGDITIYVDPYMKYNDNRMVLGRKNNPDQPGIIFVPYLMAQSISLISEATFAPRMLLRSRYAVTEVGWYPQKQYMTLVIKDDNNFLN
jgi:hypothetical protein